MKTKIISAFPGTGKSYYYKNNLKTTLDSDSSQFQWLNITKNGSRDGGNLIPNPKFPQNYINHIKNNIGKYEFIFVSSHNIVREALKNNCLYFYLLVPDIDDKDIYIKRYKDRGDHPKFIDKISKNWEQWINECLEECHCNIITMYKHNNMSYISNSIKIY
jgi:hypothetical protein